MIDTLVIGGIFREILAFDTVPRARIGGSGITAATAAVHLGATVALAGAVGSDDSAEVRNLLDGHGIRDCLVTTRGASGTFAFPDRASSERPWPLYRPAEGVVTAHPELPAAKVVVLFGIPDLDPLAEGWADSFPTETTLIWDQQGWLSRARNDELVLALNVASRIYLANEEEAAADLGADIEWALAHQPPPGFDVSIVKRGRSGVVVFVQGRASFEIPAYRIEASTTFGSGDAFAGALAAGLARGDTLSDAARAGCATAAAMIEAHANIVDEQIAKRAVALLRC